MPSNETPDRGRSSEWSRMGLDDFLYRYENTTMTERPQVRITQTRMETFQETAQEAEPVLIPERTTERRIRECGVCYRRHDINDPCPYPPYCGGCGRNHEGDRCRYCPGCDQYHGGEECCGCDSCREDRGMSPRQRYNSNVIQSWSYRPHVQFIGEGPLYLGMEWEIETNDDRYDLAERVQEIIGDLGFIKEDGSLNNGIEIVTHPIAYDYFMDKFPWKKMVTTLKEAGAFDTRETGIHVHASRAGFDGAPHTYKWLQLWHRNQVKIQRMARRRSEQWAAFNSTDRTMSKYYAKGYPRQGRLSYHDQMQMRRDLRRTTGYDFPDTSRYRAINVDTGRPTFEVRVFRSTVEEHVAQAALGLVQGTIEYTRQLSVYDIHANDGWKWKPFSQWVKKNADMYPALRKEMVTLRCVS